MVDPENEYDAVVGADRMSFGLSCIPDPVRGDIECIVRLSEALKRIRTLAGQQPARSNNDYEAGYSAGLLLAADMAEDARDQANNAEERPMPKCLAAYTPPCPPPPAMVPYINATLLDDGKVRVTVRQLCADTGKDDIESAFIDIAPERALDFANELRDTLRALADELSFIDLRASGGLPAAGG